MARKTRVFVQNMPQHVGLKSLNDISLFIDNSDYIVFRKMLKELTSKHNVEIHAYVLLPQYIAFLLTPANADALPKFMQSLGRKYVGYFNKKYDRSGTLFEGRYKASLIEDKLYLFDVMRYIEQLAPQDYLYSSIGRNLYNKTDAVVSPHGFYRQLGFRDTERVVAYTKLFNKKTDKIDDFFIENALEKQLVTGSIEFIHDLEKTIGAELGLKNRGRPKKQKKGKKMYKNLVVLDNENHKNLKISPMEDLLFAKEVPFIPVLATEVSHIGNTFPVVFSADENSSLIALVSLSGDSLAIDKEGKWITPYIPTFIRKYPFSLGIAEENPEQGVIMIDEKSSLFSKTKGKELFNKDGDQSEALSNAVAFLTDYEKQNTLSKNVTKIIADSGILEDREISVGEGEEKKVLVNGFKVINRDKLNELSDDILADWVRKGIISLIDIHLKSLDNIQTLFNLTQQKQK